MKRLPSCSIGIKIEKEITVKQIDPVVYPKFASNIRRKPLRIPVDVVSGDRSRYIAESDIYK